MIFRIILADLPGVGLLSVVWLVGIYTTLFDLALILLAFRVRGLRRRVSSSVR